MFRTMDHLRFDNRFVAELPGDTSGSPERRQTPGVAWSTVQPTPVSDPRLFAHSREVAAAVGLSDADILTPRFAQVFGGCDVLPGMAPFAACYGGHQFGHWAGQLGDGRALTLGEVVNDRGERWELQLKGAGPTPYSRTADGRAVLRSSIREFLCSEAMHHLGVPTTRALSLVGTGDAVIRDMLYDGNARPEPGAIVCRVAPSFIRLGTFELPARRGELDLLASLVDFTIRRDFPHLWCEDELGAPTADARAAWFHEVCTRTATLMVHWMRVGFVHGVMNTDNLSILGLTLDYGPYGWLEDFNPDWTPNTTDAQGRRYRYGHQPAVAQWNLTRFAEAVRPLFADTAPLEAGLTAFVETYNAGYTRMMASKFGLDGLDGDPAGSRSAPWVREGLGLLYHGEVDFTLFFRGLGVLAGAGIDPETPWIRALEAEEGRPGEIPAALLPAFYEDGKREQIHAALLTWLGGWAGALRDAWGRTPAAEIRGRMHQVNPRYVLRNYLAQEAIDLAEQGDLSRIHTLLEVLRRPYDDQPEHARFAHRRPEWARHKVGCSMLSCSS
jgi:serine/tyrosine/threonine adenylyltransferase